MLRFRREPIIVRATVMSPLNEPLAKLVYPEPPWWQNEGVAKVRDEVVDLLLQVDWTGIPGKLEKLQNFFFRRRVREA